VLKTELCNVVQSGLTVSPFTGVSVNEIRDAIIKKNDDLIKRNPNISNHLVALTGNESNNKIEKIFIDNYMHVLSNYYCSGVLIMCKLFTYVVGWQFSTPYALTVANFIDKFQENAFNDIVSAYEVCMKRNEIIVDCTTIMLRNDNKYSKHAYKLGSLFTKTLSDMLEVPYLKYVLKFVADFMSGATSAWMSFYGAGTMNELLENDVASSKIFGEETILHISKMMCENSIENKKKPTRVPKNKVNKKKSRDEIHTDIVLNFENDDTCPPVVPAPAVPRDDDNVFILE
jgi:hypothetical protein